MNINKEDLIWYSDALEKLLPLRFHLHNLLQLIDSHNKYAQRINQLYDDQVEIVIESKDIEEARKALKDTNNFLGVRKKLTPGGHLLEHPIHTTIVSNAEENK